jgi:hypothetical protein
MPRQINNGKVKKDITHTILVALICMKIPLVVLSKDEDYLSIKFILSIRLQTVVTKYVLF